MRKLTALFFIAVLAATSVYADRVAMEGRVRSLSGDRDGYRVWLDRGDYSFRVPMSVLGRHELRVGMIVRLEGNYRSGWVWVDGISWPNEREELLSGRVERINRYEQRLFVRDDRGRLVEVDGRGIGDERHRRLDLSDVHRGDRVTLRGRWGRGSFYAYRVESVSAR